jgi:hypothetical protein
MLGSLCFMWFVWSSFLQRRRNCSELGGGGGGYCGVQLGHSPRRPTVLSLPLTRTSRAADLNCGHDTFFLIDVFVPTHKRIFQYLLTFWGLSFISLLYIELSFGVSVTVSWIYVLIYDFPLAVNVSNFGPYDNRINPAVANLVVGRGWGRPLRGIRVILQPHPVFAWCLLFPSGYRPHCVTAHDQLMWWYIRKVTTRCETFVVMAGG